MRSTHRLLGRPLLSATVVLGTSVSGSVASAAEHDTDAPSTTDEPVPTGVDGEVEAPILADATAPPRPENVYGREIVNAAAAFDIGGRFFSYHDGLSDNLRDYDVFGAPGIALNVEVYPLASLGIVVLRDFGLSGEVRVTPGLSSETKAGAVVDTEWLRFGGGLRYRLPVGPDDAPYVFGLRGGLARDVFTLETTGPLAAEVPGVAYTFLRVGLDARIPMGPVALTAFGGYLGALEAGPVYERFRDSVIGGIDVGGGLTVPIALGFEAFFSAEYTRWFYAFGPVVGDAFVAGGALDENVHLEIGPQYVY